MPVNGIETGAFTEAGRSTPDPNGPTQPFRDFDESPMHARYNGRFDKFGSQETLNWNWDPVGNPVGDHLTAFATGGLDLGGSNVKILGGTGVLANRNTLDFNIGLSVMLQSFGPSPSGTYRMSFGMNGVILPGNPASNGEGLGTNCSGSFYISPLSVNGPLAKICDWTAQGGFTGALVYGNTPDPVAPVNGFPIGALGWHATSIIDTNLLIGRGLNWYAYMEVDGMSLSGPYTTTPGIDGAVGYAIFPISIFS